MDSVRKRIVYVHEVERLTATSIRTETIPIAEGAYRPCPSKEAIGYPQGPIALTIDDHEGDRG